MNQHNSSQNISSRDNLADSSLTGASARSSKDEQEPPGFRILIANEQQTLAVDESRLDAAVRSVLDASNYTSGMISIAVVDDPTIQAINRQFLQHDYPTDVLSFVLEDDDSHLEGELVVSGDTAVENAQDYGWPAGDELMLYVLHGCLHLVGHRDEEPAEQAAMHRAELEQLRRLGITLPRDQSRWLPQASKIL